MFIPPLFAESDPTKLHDFIEGYSFGLLVSQVDDVPFVSHLPFLLDRHVGPHGTLTGHMARANPHWGQIAGQTVLAVFSGPHAYISPTWYEAENVVPTWNYTAVHAYGRVQVIEDRETLLDIVQQSVTVYEATFPRPWTLDPSTPYTDRMLGQIVGFNIAIDRLEGKWKMNQNQPVERRKKVIRALQQQTDENAKAVAAMIQAQLPAED